MRRLVKLVAASLLVCSTTLQAKPSTRKAPARSFQKVLERVLDEFEESLASGPMQTVKSIAIRKFELSENVPLSYRAWVETLITERMQSSSELKVVACTPCRARTSAVVDGKLLITSPSENTAKLDAAAQTLGIDTYMDVVMIMGKDGIVLAVHVFDAKTKELRLARTFDSEAASDRKSRVALLEKRVERGRHDESYEPDWRWMIGMGAASVPNLGGTDADSRMLAAHLRVDERLAGGRGTFGLQLAYFKRALSLSKDYPSEQTGSDAGTGETATSTAKSGAPVIKPFDQGLGLYGIYGRQFRDQDDERKALQDGPVLGVHGGAGAFVAQGYVTPAVRIGGDAYFGRRFVLSIAGHYLFPSSVRIQGQVADTAGAAGGDLTVSLQY